MKSYLRKALYTGLGVLGSGKTALDRLGRDLARKAELSEKDGEKLARQLRARSEKAVDNLHKSVSAEVSKAAAALRAAIQQDVKSRQVKKPKTARSGNADRTRPAPGASRR